MAASERVYRVPLRQLFVSQMCLTAFHPDASQNQMNGRQSHAEEEHGDT